MLESLPVPLFISGAWPTTDTLQMFVTCTHEHYIQEYFDVSVDCYVCMMYIKVNGLSAW